MQNLLKSIFISVFPVFALYIVLQYGWNVIQDGISIQSIGMILAALPIVVFFAGLFLKPVARTKTYLHVYTVFIGIGLVISFFGGDFDTLHKSSILGVILIVGWLLYLMWYSVFNKRDTTILKVGQKLPNVTLENIQKKSVSITDFFGNYKTLEERGVNTVFISPQPHTFSEQLSKKHGLQFQFLTDVNNRTAKQLGILSKNGIPFGFQALGYDSDTVLPTVVITDREGVIQFVDLTDNYRVRPEPEFFMKYI